MGEKSKINEFTVEITDFCRHNCKYCSSNTTDDYSKGLFPSVEEIEDAIKDELERRGVDRLDRLNISGGEPLAHPQFYFIWIMCEKYAEDVVLYSNLVPHRMYNMGVIDGVTLEGNLTVDDYTKKIHILKRVKQGREAKRPEVKFSKNFTEQCACDHHVMRPNGRIVKTPCNKYTDYDEE